MTALGRGAAVAGAALLVATLSCGGRTALLPAPFVDGGTTSGGARVDAGGAPGRCYGGFAACAGACVDTLNDPAHCGGCGRDCAGGACKLGTCEPTVLASDQLGIADFAAAKTGLYWTRWMPQGNVVHLPPSGGAPRVVAAEQLGPFSLTVDDASVYWTNVDQEGNGKNGSVYKAGLTSGAPVALAERLYRPGGLEVSGGELYWLDEGALHRLSVGGGMPSPVSKHSTFWYPAGSAIDAEAYYLGSSSGGIWRLPLRGGTPPDPNELTKVSGPFVLAGELVYFADGSSIQRVSRSGGPATAVVSSDGGRLRAVAVDGDRVYWADQGGAIFRAPVGGGARSLLATSSSAVGRLAILGRRVVWTTQSGLIMAVAK
ncbi:MAG: hypothetical protein IT371_20425 [Deltaproteobacteria bacterium]|nr:hypothetical protein [Deltaproteobacteria bacterium]